MPPRPAFLPAAAARVTLWVTLGERLLWSLWGTSSRLIIASEGEQRVACLMRTSLVNGRLYRRVSACLVFLACSLVAPLQARAACTHYASSRSQLPRASVQLERWETWGLSTAVYLPPGQASTERPDPSAPCRGAMCSGNQPLPMTPVPLPLERNSQWAMCEFPALIAEPSSVLAPRDDACLLPLSLSGSIFHPPRTRSLHSVS
jgi:hypothetical protein